MSSFRNKSKRELLKEQKEMTVALDLSMPPVVSAQPVTATMAYPDRRRASKKQQQSIVKNDNVHHKNQQVAVEPQRGELQNGSYHEKVPLKEIAVTAAGAGAGAGFDVEGTVVSGIDDNNDMVNSSLADFPEEYAHLADALGQQGYPIGLAQQVCVNAKLAHPIRFWVMDNSGSMLTPDGSEVRSTINNHDNKNHHDNHMSNDAATMVMMNCTRWSELKGTILRHVNLAATLQATTYFRFLNDPGKRAGPQEFSLAEQLEPGFIQEDVDLAFTVMNNAVPKGATPLVFHLQEIRMKVEAMTDVLNECGQQVAIVLATDGLPTDALGDSTEQVKEEFIANLKALQSLPVWIVIRLCTNDLTVVNYYNTLDANLELPLEVIDDFLGEAKEVQRVNAWLNYTRPLHTCREMGYHNRVFDLLDERLLTKDELLEFLQLLFGKQTMQYFPDIYHEWKGFCVQLKELVQAQGLHYNPLYKKATPWIDMKQLEQLFGDPSVARQLFCIFRR
mmetsp:Transcript_5021/g.6551  ORF Transcript_5021/g.6551 Transcript_5021/m.6551 type:complete len:504 (-) Transcript_5021:354-1865(-)|eukprot:CAMPEP_0198139776 /NCGR_PEP_ID=MMETSP1443-20131203/3011_1 /TAXON_ID=186043 /ORGANISM="Entomoneis sp., Strain CCMP2396" /LENGTH=503 /DNA_ID=CAMNT_0043801995 /DNA_START=265 /DNA_END=1776 /DNA_ORIENTATION=+